MPNLNKIKLNNTIYNFTNQLVDLSSYAAGDVVPTETALALANPHNTAYHENDYYRIVTDTHTMGMRMILFAALNSANGGGGFYLYLTDGTTDWKFSGVIEIAILGYDADNILNIKIDNTDKCFRLKDSSIYTTIKKDSTQTTDIVLQLPKTDGTLALTSDINSTNIIAGLGYTPYNATNPSGYITGITSKNVTDALGYTPYNSTNPSNYVTANVSTLNNYYTKTAVDGMVANRFQAKIVTALPTSGISTSTIYMIADATAAFSVKKTPETDVLTKTAKTISITVSPD